MARVGLILVVAVGVGVAATVFVIEDINVSIVIRSSFGRLFQAGPTTAKLSMSSQVLVTITLMSILASGVPTEFPSVVCAPDAPTISSLVEQFTVVARLFFVTIRTIRVALVARDEPFWYRASALLCERA